MSFYPQIKVVLAHHQGYDTLHHTETITEIQNWSKAENNYAVHSPNDTCKTRPL